MTLDRLPLEVLIGPAFIADLSNTYPSQEIIAEDLKRIIGEQNPERLILRFDWSENWAKHNYYTEHPYLSEEAAEWIIDRNIKLLAMDTPTPDDPRNSRGTEKDSPVHKLLLDKNIVLVEYLCNLKKLIKQKIELIVLPLKIQEGDGAPVRCVAIEDYNGGN
jgi:arylformamidase